MPNHENPQLKLANEFVQNTGANIFLTGKAGTGKTTFLHNIKAVSPKRMIVTAPTGVAAINAGGVTLHSFFQLPFGPQIPRSANTEKPSQPAAINKFGREKANILRSIDLLVIDEISMVRADLLDAVDEVLRRYKNRYKPFGGVQLLMIGDLQQLAPVVKEDEWDLLKPYYDTPFFFSSLALKKTEFISIELKHIYRQSDLSFIELLNKIRENKLDKESIEILNKRYIPNFEPKKNEGYITLTTHNNQANRINDHHLGKIRDHEHIFTAEVSGNFPEYSYPTNPELILKKGAQVMFVKNDASREKRYFNGKIGTVARIEDEVVYVSCVGEDGEIAAIPTEWNNFSYSIDDKTNEIIENVIGTFMQVPLKLAWAITIHKSQGLTFDKAIIDANAAFAHGQVYVALSRCRTMEGIVLSSKIETHSIKSDGSVLGFTRNIENNPPDEERLSKSRQDFERSLLTDLNNFTTIQRRLEYCLKLVREHESILHGKPGETCETASDTFYNDILKVSQKFVPQLNQLFVENPNTENNKPLKGRLSKACGYYCEKMDMIFDTFFDNFRIETDNKAVKKSIKEATTRLSDEIRQKRACIEIGKSGFAIKKYMEARAKSAIEKEPERQTKAKEWVAADVQNPKLSSILKNWRDTKAEEMNVPVYIVLPLKTISELSAKLPQTLAQLETIKGFGKQKVRTIGTDILELINSYCKENNIETGQFDFDIKAATEEPKKTKIDTKLVSLEFFKMGKTVTEIALERQMVEATIEKHLSHYVALGELDISDLVDEAKIKLIRGYFTENDNLTVGQAKAALGDKVTWGELHLVVAQLKKE